MKVLFIFILLITSTLSYSQTKGSLTGLQNSALQRGVPLNITEGAPSAFSSKDTIVIPLKKRLVADETWIVATGDKQFRIICDNEKIQSMIISRFNTDMKRISGISKQDRGGFYWEYSYYFDNYKYPIVLGWLELLSVVKK